MPCNDITEKIRIVLDREERLRSYSLDKKACGGAVGISSLLIDRIVGMTVDELLALSETEFYRGRWPINSIEEFLNLKHILAVKAVLRVYAGGASDGEAGTCTISSIDDDGGRITIDAEIDIPLMTEKIKACASGCHR